MIPHYPNFTFLELRHLEIIAEFLEKYQPLNCELALANLFSWRNIENTRITLINDNLCFFMNPDFDEPFFLEPVGNNKIEETLAICFNYCPKIKHVSNLLVNKINGKNFKIIHLSIYDDYLYLRKELADLKGRKFDAKRNHINKFRRLYPNYGYQEISVSLKDQVIELFDNWLNFRNDNDHLTLGFQKKILTDVFTLIPKIPFYGGVLLLENKVQGFILGSELNHKTVCIHYFFANTEIRGIYQVLLNLACKISFEKFELVNLEEDLGLPSLKQAKESYQPLRLEPKYEIISV